MNINFYTWVHPSGYEYKFEDYYRSYSHITALGEKEFTGFKLQCFTNKEKELAVKKQVDLKSFINDVYLAFKHIDYVYKKDRVDTAYYLTEPGYVIGEGPNSIIKEDSMKRVIPLINKYGLVDSAKIVIENQAFKRKYKISEDLRSDNFTSDLQKVQENIYDWNEVIDKVMSMKYEDNHKESLVEVSDIRLTLHNGNIHLTPLTLLSAIDCSTFNKGISICGYCDAPFVRKRTNQEYCGNSCRASASRKRRS